MSKLSQGSRSTLKQALAAYREQAQRRVEDGVRSAATLEMIEAHERWLLSVIGGDSPLDEITEARLHAVLEALPRKGPHRARVAGPETLRKRLSTLRGVLSLAHRRGVLRRVPALPQVLAPARPRKLFLRTVADAERLFDSLPRHRAEWFWVCLWTAQHASDVDRMRWDDVRPFDDPPQFLRRNTKNGSQEKWVVCPAPLAQLLRELHARDRPAGDAPIVRPWHPSSRRRTLGDHCGKLGLPRLNAIDLRHTCLSWAVAELGITPEVWEYAGHTGPSMLSRHYAHALRAQLPSVARSLSGFAVRSRRHDDDPRGRGDD